ncbi:MAG: hypothetical protein ACFFDT_27040 [Candidatus Hodarchaeota archaeon]
MVTKYDLRLILVGSVAFIGYFLLIYFESGLTTSGLVIYFAIFGLAAMFSFMISEVLERIAGRIHIKKADKGELRREDDVLLQATGFSQSVLFIYLNLVPPNEIVDVFKFLVPFTAIVFYVLRGYAKIRNSNKYRYYSVRVFVFIIANSLSAIVWTINPFPLFIEGTDVSYLLLAPIYLSFAEAPQGFTKILCRNRYDYVGKWET